MSRKYAGPPELRSRTVPLLTAASARFGLAASGTRALDSSVRRACRLVAVLTPAILDLLRLRLLGTMITAATAR